MTPHERRMLIMLARRYSYVFAFLSTLAFKSGWNYQHFGLL